ncbi:Serralysin C precursor [Bremerella volcania]|uniref:Serralysin C n=1 Tax=Bremerella volcania TaxID=2527984 RepID=A0A518C9F4_9BACT|nr:endonuclease/exonuclease/phosphatase family protein [Bremerella volcania]QDU75851.1 Serralysin C precursor [Bremerella volcania]
MSKSRKNGNKARQVSRLKRRARLEGLEDRRLLAVVATEDFDGNQTNLITGFDPSTDNLDGGGGDFFGVGNTGNWPQADGVPFSLADDSVVDISGGGVFAGDDEGVFGQNRDANDDFFGLADTREWGTPSASWQFDVSNFENLELSIDLGGISDADFGGFNATTSVVFTAQIDGGATQTAFEIVAVNGTFVTRPMDSGMASGGGRLLEVSGDNSVEKTLADTGAAAADTFLDKTPASGSGAGEMDTFTTALNGTGSILTLTMTADVPFEAMAFDNIVVTGDSTGADMLAPVVAVVSPEDESVDVPVDANLHVTFNEDIVKGTGFITLDDGVSPVQIHVTSTDVTISGNQVTINPPADLLSATSYTVIIDAGAFEDTSGNASTGIADPTFWNFTTAVADLAPEVTENGPFAVSDQAPAGTVVGDVDSTNDGEQDSGVTYEIVATVPNDAMAEGQNGYSVEKIFTVGETFSGTSGAYNPTTAGDYTPPGVVDGLGAFALDAHTVRVFANHELLNFSGYDYEVSDGAGGTFTMDGARISYFDFDKETRQIVDAGLAYNTIYDANGNVATDISFLANDLIGFSRFCSGMLIEPHQFGNGSGLEDRIYFAPEEDGGTFNTVGGAVWALDAATGDLWAIPGFGRGGWENVTEVDTGTSTHVAFLLADDTSPFNVDGDADPEAAPMYMYVGEKNASGDFLERNGLRDGKLYVWVSNTGETTPSQFNTAGTLNGSWVEVDNSPTGTPSEDGSTGYDEYGYPTQRTLWTEAESLGAFGFSRPEDVATNPADGTEVALASTGVDTYDGGADTFGTIYTFKNDFSNLSAPTATLTIVYDGDADLTRALRSPDNLDWADDGFIYVQEDKAEDDSLTGEPLFGPGAANPNEAGIVQVDPTTGATLRVANVDRSVVLDPSTGNPADAFDLDAGVAGEWESSGILDVSTLFGEAPGTLFMFDVQAHGIADQSTASTTDEGPNADSRISDNDLVEGGQLLFLKKSGFKTAEDAMAKGVGGYHVDPLFTVGDTIPGTSGEYNSSSAGDYTPPGVIDGLGAYQLDANTVRVFANHELLNFHGYDYEVSDGNGGTFTMDGARISYIDIDKHTRTIVDAGIAYNTIYDAYGNVATDISFLANDLIGFSRFCSGILMEAEQFGNGRGLEDRIYFAGEEDGGFFNGVGGAEWALDPETGNLWQVPAFGRGAWENITEIDTGKKNRVAFILSDDTSPFDFDNDGQNEAAPLYMYVGKKHKGGDFLDRNGLRDGKLYVWVADDASQTTPADFNTAGTLAGSWVEIDNSPNLGLASEDGSTGYDEYGYPTQGNLWLQAEALGAFGFSRPEDVATNPKDGTEIVLASTGVDNYVGGADTFGTLYTVKTDFSKINKPTATVTIIYDGDSDATRGLRSPDNLDWADDGFIYVQEDKAEDASLSGEPLFGPGAVNPNEAGIVRVNPNTGVLRRIANIDRNVVVDPSIADPEDAFDLDAGTVGEWESSGILDVSTLFGEAPGSLFLFDVQAHGIVDQSTASSGGEGPNPGSRITDNDLVEGGQLAFLSKSPFEINPNTGVITVANEGILDAEKVAAYQLQISISDGSNTTFTTVDVAVTSESVASDNGVRFATYNASLNRNSQGELIEDLSTLNNSQAQAIAEIIQRNNPDVVLINEFDFDNSEIAANLFRDNYLEVSQNGADPVYYPYVYVAPSNTGVASGFDLDNSGSVGGGNDAYGFGLFEGQFGMVLFSKYEIDELGTRTFQEFLWKDMPGALLPADPNDADGNGDFDNWHTPEELEVVRLSSKSHWDVPILVNGKVIHALTAHPTPPVFDGDEDRNGRRNFDEIRFWSDYISPGEGDYIYDDNGYQGGLLAGESFVIMGDYNSDPFDGDSIPGAAQQLLENRYVNTAITPTSTGGVEFADAGQIGNPAFDTSFFQPTPGNLRVDYVLPSQDLEMTGAQVFWPESSDPNFPLVSASDHRLVYVDLIVGAPEEADVRLDDKGTLVIRGTDSSDLILVTQFFSNLIVSSGLEILGVFNPANVTSIVGYGFGGNDLISINGGIEIAASLFGGHGNDVLSGSEVDDVLAGGFGNDLILGDKGDDLLIGGFDHDLLIGGRGRDTRVRDNGELDDYFAEEDPEWIEWLEF